MYIPTTSDFIHQTIQSMLMSGELKPGEKINIDELSRTFNISKTPIREVLKKLEQEGLLNYYPRVGWEVKKLSKEKYFDAVELQELLEGYICLNISEYISNIDFEKLEKVNSEIAKVISNKEYENILELNEKFHLLIYDAYPNMQLLDNLQSVWNGIRMHRNIMVSTPDFVNNIIEEHSSIISALKNRDINVLVVSIKQHFKSGRDAIYKYYQSLEQ